MTDSVVVLLGQDAPVARRGGDPHRVIEFGRNRRSAVAREPCGDVADDCVDRAVRKNAPDDVVVGVRNDEASIGFRRHPVGMIELSIDRGAAVPDEPRRARRAGDGCDRAVRRDATDDVVQ